MQGMDGRLGLTGVPRPGSDDDDPEAARAKAKVLASLLGEDEPVSPLRVGRFVLLERLGAGGMGVVWAAYDPDLDRRIALKLLPDQRADAHPRLMREAQAMAKLNHPNVAAVYEVGAQGAQLYLAMELVAGDTLRAWLDAKRRPWREVLAVYVQAGRGLAAAHALGIVHRDFKPDNAVVGSDGRVRVVDFGLARRDTDAAAEARTLETGHDTSGTASDIPLTRSGAVLGTPRYMAPEQWLAQPTDAKTDQFSFCVALWEALCGERPFSGDTPKDLAVTVTTGVVNARGTAADLPPWLRRVLERGLAVQPSERWPSLDALLAALQRGRERARIYATLAGLAAVVVAVAVVIVAQDLAEQGRIAACEDAGATIEEVWNDDARAAVRAGLLATGAHDAATASEKAMPWLDAQAEAWRIARTDACLDVEVRERWDADLLDRSLWCLDDRRLELAALIDELRDADAHAVSSAVEAAAGLRQVQPCRDAALLQRLPLPPTAAREQIDAARATLSEAGAVHATGAYARGLTIARDALAQAEAVGWAPLVAAARLRVGHSLEITGKYAEVESMVESAYFEAAAAGATEEALAAAETLSNTVGVLLERHDEGERWAKLADLQRAALPDPAGLREANALSHRASLRMRVGAYPEAQQMLERALVLYEHALGPDHPEVAMTLQYLSAAHHALGALAPAVAAERRALAIREQVLGPRHAEVGVSLFQLGNLHLRAGEYVEGRAAYERAAAILEASLGADHPEVGTALAGLAMQHTALGNHDEAEALYGRALAIWERALGPDHLRLAGALNNLGVIHFDKGRLDEAQRLYERALRIRETALGQHHPEVSDSLNNIANVMRSRGDNDAAQELYERALAIRETALGPDHPRIAECLHNLGNVRRDAGAVTEARELYQRALRIFEAAWGPESVDVALVLESQAVLSSDTGAHAEAGELYERALSIREKVQGSEHTAVAPPLLGLAGVALVQDRPEDAVALAERASRLHAAAEAAPLERADGWFMLARALVAAGHDEPRALALARQARDVYRGAGEQQQELADEVEVFVREHSR
jgi:tetratricopeptide (TPR) repeat protein